MTWESSAGKQGTDECTQTHRAAASQNNTVTAGSSDRYQREVPLLAEKTEFTEIPVGRCSTPSPAPTAAVLQASSATPRALLLLSRSFLWIRSIKIPNVTLPSQEQAVQNQLSALQREKNRNTKVQRTALFYMAGFFNPEEQFRKMEVFLKIASLLCSMLKKKSKPGENGKYKNKYAFMMILQPHTK